MSYWFPVELHIIAANLERDLRHQQAERLARLGPLPKSQAGRLRGWWLLSLLLRRGRHAEVAVAARSQVSMACDPRRGWLCRDCGRPRSPSVRGGVQSGLHQWRGRMRCGQGRRLRLRHD